MSRFPLIARRGCTMIGALALAGVAHAAGEGGAFPIPLESYPQVGDGVLAILRERARIEPFNLVATAVFVLAIIHTFLTAKFRHWAHEVEAAHCAKLEGRARPASDRNEDNLPDEVSFKGQILHFLGEVEAVFGTWVIVLIAAISWFKGWPAVVDYIGHRVNFTEPMFVVVIMALASTRPVLVFAEQCLRAIASLGRGSVAAWWLAILIVAPVLGSFITEPAAMTIAALLLARQFYELKPSPRFCYATIGLLFVNVSVGGTLTHFAAPPVLMVAAPWQWDTLFMLTHFGWKAFIGIVVATSLYFAVFRREFAALQTERNRQEQAAGTSAAKAERAPIPAALTLVQLGFMALIVFVAHYPALFIGAFLFFLAFAQATAHHQDRMDLRPPLLVGFFLAGLVIHGGLQGWWIEPVLKSLTEVPLFVGATMLTAVNDNAAITYLATLVPGFTDALKYAVVAGAVTGGGLTVIANAPNPAGQAILQRYFPNGVSPLGLLVGALMPTLIMALAFMLL
jgi:Na+/H+ antiporter NhaD/arsenite permease-like protein